jgi:hypothetical protein
MMTGNKVAADRRRRKFITALWALGVGVLVIVLIYLERADILYILCSLGVTALLVVVAMSDLAHAEVGSDVAQGTNAPGVAAKTK